MGQKHNLLTSIFLGFAMALPAQAKKLGKSEFQAEVADKWWSFENKESKKDCDMRIFVIRTGGFELNCINWANGFSGNKCSFALNLTDNFFELKALKCQDDLSPGFLYGYLSENNNLFLLLRKEQMPISPALFSEKDWIRFEPVKR